MLRVPPETVVVPVWALAPERVSVPLPALVRAPEVEALAPEMVRFVAAVETSIVDVVAAVRVKLRLVEDVAPVYWSVPPPRTRLAAALVAFPRLPATPPLPIVATERVPALIVVTPV